MDVHCTDKWMDRLSQDASKNPVKNVLDIEALSLLWRQRLQIMMPSVVLLHLLQLLHNSKCMQQPLNHVFTVIIYSGYLMMMKICLPLFYFNLSNFAAWTQCAAAVAAATAAAEKNYCVIFMILRQK